MVMREREGRRGEREREKRAGASKRGKIGKKEAQDLNSFCASYWLPVCIILDLSEACFLIYKIMPASQGCYKHQ